MIVYSNNTQTKKYETWSSAAFGVILFLFILFTLIYDIVEINGNSMYPYYKDGQYVVLDHQVVKDQIKRFEVVRVDIEKYDPKSRHSSYVKRVIGIPGDTVEVKHGFVYVNGRKVEEFAFGRTYPHNEEYDKITLNDDELYLLGDNREKSKDSRDFGPVVLEDVISKK